MERGLVLPHERVDDLQRNGLRMIQNPAAFCFGMDAVLLADFVTLRKGETIADLGTGTGILPVLLSQKEKTAQFHAIEIQPDMADMAGRTMELNGLAQRIQVHALDLREAPGVLGYERMDAVVCNPPYGKQGSSLPSAEPGVLVARHETDCSLREIVAAGASLLKNHGRIFLVFPSPRLLELCDALREKRLEPKRVRLVCAKASRAPYLVLLEAMKNARPGLAWLPPLVVYQEDGSETEELRRIYHQEDTGSHPAKAFP